MQFDILSAAIALKGNAYGLEIKRFIESRQDDNLASGAVYATLHRLKRKGWLTSTVTEPTSVRGGRRRTVYRITDTGRQAMLEREARLRASLDLITKATM